MRKLKRDLVVSSTDKGDLVRVYWADTKGDKVLFEMRPEEADDLIKRWNEKRELVCPDCKKDLKMVGITQVTTGCMEYYLEWRGKNDRFEQNDPGDEGFRADGVLNEYRCDECQAEVTRLVEGVEAV